MFLSLSSVKNPCFVSDKAGIFNKLHFLFDITGILYYNKNTETMERVRNV